MKLNKPEPYQVGDIVRIDVDGPICEIIEVNRGASWTDRPNYYYKLFVLKEDRVAHFTWEHEELCPMPGEITKALYQRKRP